MKKTLKFRFALIVGKLAMLAQKILGMNASYFPGKLAIKLCPDFCGRIDKPEKIIAVTGTNGKTTCCNLALGVLEDNGFDVLNNRLGSNIAAGVASSLISGSTISGKATKKMALFEVDERSSRLIYKYITPDLLLCTNLFRDSIKRNAHPEYIFNFINSAVPKSTRVILNGDDVISGRLAPDNHRVYYSVNPMAIDSDHCENIVNDMSICPVCHANLEFSHVRYHQIGKASCPSCGFSLPEADYKADVDVSSMTLTVSEQGAEHSYKLINDSIFNIYNELGVIALLREFGLSPESINRSFENGGIVGTRYTAEEYHGMQIITNMAKSLNPIACSSVFDYVRRKPGTKEVILILSGAAGTKESSENVTWMYDTDFQFLNQPEIKHIIIGGLRAADIKLRLLIAGVPDEKLQCTHNEADTTGLLKLDCESVYILHDLHFSGIATKMKDTVKQMISAKEAL